MIGKRCWSLFLVAFAAILGGNNPIAAEEPAFAIYLLKEAEQPRRVKATPIDRLHLSDNPLLTEADVVVYHWATHDVQLSAAARKRLPRPGVSGEPFVVVVDGKRVYVGAFFSSISSMSHSGPVVVVDPIPQRRPPEGCIRIDGAYPTDKFRKGKDVRQDLRVRTCLIRLGKLTESAAKSVSKQEARKLAWKEYIRLTRLNILGEEHVVIVGKHTLDFDVPGFAKRSEQVWEAHATKLGASLRGVLWVHASSGEVKGVIGHWDQPGR